MEREHSRRERVWHATQPQREHSSREQGWHATQLQSEHSSRERGWHATQPQREHSSRERGWHATQLQREHSSRERVWHATQPQREHSSRERGWHATQQQREHRRQSGAGIPQLGSTQPADTLSWPLPNPTALYALTVNSHRSTTAHVKHRNIAHTHTKHCHGVLWSAAPVRCASKSAHMSRPSPLPHPKSRPSSEAGLTLRCLDFTHPWGPLGPHPQHPPLQSTAVPVPPALTHSTCTSSPYSQHPLSLPSPTHPHPL